MFSADDSVVIASYDSHCNLPFPEPLLKGSAPELVQYQESYFHYFPKGDKSNPIRFTISAEDDLLGLVFSVCAQRK